MTAESIEVFNTKFGTKAYIDKLDVNYKKGDIISSTDGKIYEIIGISYANNGWILCLNDIKQK